MTHLALCVPFFNFWFVTRVFRLTAHLPCEYKHSWVDLNALCERTKVSRETTFSLSCYVEPGNLGARLNLSEFTELIN